MAQEVVAMSDGDLMLTGEVGRALRVSGARVRQMVKDGSLGALRTATGGYIFNRSEVLALAERRHEVALRRAMVEPTVPR